MEIYRQFKQNGYYTADLYHLLSKRKIVDTEEVILPSEYEKEMKLSTQERLQMLHKIDVANIVSMGPKPNTTSVILDFTPKVIVFQNFKPNEKVVTKFSVKNISKAPIYLNMVNKESSYFFVKPVGGKLLSRLAPGIGVTFNLTFRPVQFMDYVHKVTFSTERDQYVLPIFAMGPRPVFDFPDEITVPAAALKVQNEVRLLLHNIGLVTAGFKLDTKCPFNVQPKSVYLNPNEHTEITAMLKTMRLGHIEGSLFALFETGEIFKIRITGSTFPVRIEVEKPVVRFHETYKTMVRQQTLKITNKSDHLLTYMCMKNEDVIRDFDEKVKLVQIFHDLKTSEAVKCQKLAYYDVVSCDENDRVYTRIYFDQIHSLVVDETLSFQDSHFSITPINGNIWPNKPTELTITFNPQAIGEFKAVAYLDIDGTADRIPLSMVGTSLPPEIVLNLETLDMDRVYINKKYNYEVVATNKGHINGVIAYKDTPTLFGSLVTCTPAFRCLRPGERDLFVISFCNSNQGPYFEEINFIIRDTEVVLKLYLKGEVIYPSLMFSVPSLDFGVVSLGLPKTLEFEVINESIVDVIAYVKISSDGPEVSSIELIDYAVEDIPKPEIPHWPKEFNIQPSKICLGPESRITLTVTLTANLIRANQLSLELELDKSDSPPIILPLTFDARVPELTPAPDIRIRGCFLDFPYKYEIQVQANEIKGYYTVVEQEEEATLQVILGNREGFIEPNSTITFPVTIRTCVLGVQEYTIRLKLFGLSEPVDICHILECGVRPIVTCTPAVLHWGQVKILTRSRKTLTLLNDSPVVVYFKAFVLNRDGKWTIQPSEGHIEAEGEIDLHLTLYLVDADSYVNKAVIQLERVKDIFVPLSATGVGTSIVVGELRDRVVLGRHFTKIKLNCTVEMENKGTRMHALEWSEHYKAPKAQPLTTAFFNLEPKFLKMAPGEKVDLTITGVSHKVTTVKETWYLVGSVEGINKKELLLACEIVAEFVDPKIELTPLFIEFQHNFGPYSEYYKLTDIVTIKNVSMLPLNIDINIKPPFAIIKKKTTYKIHSYEANKCACICYRESDLDMASILKIGAVQSKIFIDYLTSKPVEPLRKGPLNFFHDINKIKMAFHLTQSVEEHLEDQDVMKIQVLFDTTKHTTLKSRNYNDLLKVQLKGHKNKDAVKILGKINFPNVLVVPPKVDFQCINNSSIESKTVKLQNNIPLVVCFRFRWRKIVINTNVMPDLSEEMMPCKDNGNTTTSYYETDTMFSKPEDKLQEILSEQCRAPFQSPTDTAMVSQVGIRQSPLNLVNPPLSEESEYIRPTDLEISGPNLMRKITPMLPFNYDVKFPWVWKFRKVCYERDKINTNVMLRVTPITGIMKPNDSQYVHIIFAPTHNVNFKGVLECEVLGGPSELISVTGQSSDLKYKLNTQRLNFKIRSCHENATELLILTNTARVVFEYRTYLNEPKYETELNGTILDLLPAENTLQPEETTEIKVVVRPGVVGYFHCLFMLEIGHVPHIPIEVFGWGVIPQVYLSLPRPEIAKLHPEIGYAAISALTDEYLGAVSEIFSFANRFHANTPQTHDSIDDPDLRNWHVCSEWDGYPSVMDIELAIERTLLAEHVQTRPEILVAYSTKSKTGPIPGFLTTPYVIDFGVVITNSVVQCVVEIINYGPIATKLHFAKPINFPTWLGLKLCGKLNPGESGKLEVSFSPTSEIFFESEEYVETSFKIEVPYGITIPVKVKALCAVPYLASNVDAIDFGSVRCGDKVVSTIALKNVGKPTCIWYVTLKLRASGQSPMTVLDNSGKYEPGEGGLLSIAFKPTRDMVYEGLLLFRFHMNPRKMAIPISGIGIVPQVHVIGPNVAFPPTLPWAERTDYYFALTNPCPFPVELIFAHSDHQSVHEEEIYQLLHRYYNKPEEMLVPVITPGDGLPEEILNFYTSFQERVKKEVEAEAVASRNANAKNQALAKRKVTKTPKSAKSAHGSPKPAEATAQKKFRTEAEIITDEIKALKDKDVDPLKQCLKKIEDVVPTIEKEYDKGLIVFMHGSPAEETQSQEMAYTIGMKLGLPTINIDLCMVEALCCLNTEAKEIIMNATNEAYDNYMSSVCPNDSAVCENAEEDVHEDTENEFDLVLKKVQTLANSRNKTTPRSKTADKKKKEPSSGVEAMGSTTMFQLELTQELLAQFFNQPKFRRGFVVDSLTSFIFNSPPTVLTTILKCTPSIQNIHLILCQSDFNKWAQAYEENLRETEMLDEPAELVYSESEIIQIVKEINEMDGEEFDKLTPEFRSLYVTHGLNERRKKYIEKTRVENAERRGENIKGQCPYKTALPPFSSAYIDEPSQYLQLRKVHFLSKESTLHVKNSEDKKKVASKKDEKGGKNANSEYLSMQNKYNEYNKITYDSLVAIANNWIFKARAIGLPLYGLNGHVMGGVQKRGKTKSETQLTLQFDDDPDHRGFPLTLIMCPCLRYKEALVKMFLDATIIQKALKDDDQVNILGSPMGRKEFTVLLPKTRPYIHHELPLKWCFLDELPVKKCECNQTTNLSLLDDTTQDNIINILSKWHCTCGKKMASSSTSITALPGPVSPISADESLSGEKSEEFYPIPLPLHSVKTIPAPAKRVVLQPGDLMRCKYSFSPQWEGHFSVKRYVEICGWPESRVTIHVTGICDVPRIDSRPKKMFANFVRRANFEGNVYKITYLDELDLFEFGPIFIGQNRIYEEDYSIDLKNSSLIKADIDIEFFEPTTVFGLDKTFISLEPGERGKLKVTAAPAEVGVHQSLLLFCVKDNPEIVTVVIQCSGVVPIVEILPLTKTIDYGKLLLYRREDDRFIVKNDSILPIMWKVRNAVEFVEDFIIAQTSGIVARYDNQVVPVTYIASRVNVITNKIMIIDIYDALDRGNPMLVEELYLSAECYDVNVECAYENPAVSCLDYGNVKVNSTYTKLMFLLNRGKYNIYYKLKKVKNFPEPSLLKSFEVVNESGIIPINMKLVAIEFTCTPTTSMNLVNVPVYTCSLLDGSKKQVVVAKFPVCITLASFYNTFTLFPLGELNFNIIAIGSSIIKEVILNNTSKCPVTYEIVLPEEYRVLPEPTVKIKEGGKIKNPPLKCGNFLIINEDSLLPPGTSRIIQIQFFASGMGRFMETIKFIISDTCPAEASGVPLKLVGIGAMPTLDFWNTENTFREHLITKNLADYKVPETSPHCVFVENSVTLHFFCVTVNTKFMGAIDLYNNGLVACALTMQLLNELNAEPDIFTLDKYETHIEPLQHKCLRITFNPKALKEYRAVLEIKLNLLNNQQQSFRTCLIGEGVIPRIKMVWPPTKQFKCSLLQMPVTCLGSISSRTIRFKNICSVKSFVVLNIKQLTAEERTAFWLSAAETSEHNVIKTRKDQSDTRIKFRLKPDEQVGVVVHYNPAKKGRTSCEIYLRIIDNPYEYFTVFCEAEGFMEDVILIGLEMLSMDTDLLALQNLTEESESTVSTVDSRKRIKKKEVRQSESKKSRSITSAAVKSDMPTLKYILALEGCELGVMQKRTVVMVNNSDKVYKFKWDEVQYLFVKPSVGYISPGEEKDLEIVYFSDQPVTVKKELLFCNLSAVSDNSLTLDTKGPTWDSRQTVTTFDHNRETFVVERSETVLNEQVIEAPAIPIGSIKMIVVYSVTTEYSKYSHTLKEGVLLKDIYIYQTKQFDFKVTNIGKVPMKVIWSFQLDDDFPTTVDNKLHKKEKEDNKESTEGAEGQESIDPNAIDSSKTTLYSENSDRTSVDTWFEVTLPFKIEPVKACLEPSKSQKFTVTFSPIDAFAYKVLLKSSIDNLDPCDQNMFCRIMAKSLVPYCHLDIEESDYLTSGRRKEIGLALPEHITVMEFNVLGSGCYKKSFNVINPTSEAYEFTFEMITDKIELLPFHCNMMKGYIEGGTSKEVTFTFAPTASGVYESQWKFTVEQYNVSINLLVVGLVREPDVFFVPTILIVRNSLVGFSTTDTVKLTNNEDEALNFEFKGNSLLNESGKTPVVMDPEQGILKPRSETPIKFIYTPVDDGPLSFKIFCAIKYMPKNVTLCVNALSLSIRPKVTYFLIGNEHVLDKKAITHIHLDQTASTYTRTLTFLIKNEGSSTFFYEWSYSSAEVKKYLTVAVEPRSGHVAPALEQECTLSFTLKTVPVQAFPVTLFIVDGPEYSIFLHSKIEKPLYHFSCKNFEFDKCVINAPDNTYKKVLGVVNNDKVPILLALDFEALPELLVDYKMVPAIEPKQQVKVKIYFKPKEVKEYEFKVRFWVNSLCEEIVTVKGEGVKCLFDLYEGCEKSFDMGPVKVGSKIVRQIEVMNHSKVPIDASFIFKTMYPMIDDTLQSEATSVCLDPSAASPADDGGPSRTQMVKNYNDDKVRNQIAMDIENALSSLKVVPKECKILPYHKAPLKIQFKPVGMISDLNVQLNMKVLNIERPLVRLSGCATGMSLCLSQDSLQFGRVRVRGCKILKVMLLNKGDFGARFWWQPLMSADFKISPMQGHIAAHTNVTYTITYKPKSHNPFVKIWASCNIENYPPQELAMYAACLDSSDVQSKTIYMECPVREVEVAHLPITNPTDAMWYVESEMQPGPFATLVHCNVEPNSVYDIPIYFKPKTMGRHDMQLLYTNLGEGALFISLLGVALPPNPTSVININVSAKDVHTEVLKVYHITESPESYAVSTEIEKIIPEKFESFYEIKHPDTVKVWGETHATCRWDYVCYAECEMHMKVMFVNKTTKEYQFYQIVATVTPSEILDTITMTSRARESVQQEVVVKNPLAVSVSFFVRCQQLDCPSSIDVGRQSQAPLVITYSPLVVGESEECVEISNELVGTYVYRMILKCLPAKAKEMEIETPIGTRVPMRLRLQNKSNVRAVFTSSVTHPSITTDVEYYLGPYEKGKFLVWFEPTEVGVQKCTVTFDSPDAGEFVYRITGTAEKPKPQGPYEIRAGSYTAIKFKNIFMETRRFKVSVDKQDFYVKNSIETIRSKQEAIVIVYLGEKWGGEPTGCLTVESIDPPEPGAQWTFFLQGIP